MKQHMGRQITNKRKRVSSLQPNKNHKAIFARRYASHLVPALKKIKMNNHSSQGNHKTSEETVKHEVDMALALSAQEFAWSRFLQQKLLSSPHEDPSYSLERSNNKQDCGEEEEEEEEAEIQKRLKELQKLLPGGEEMNMDVMLSEIGSYIVCLELQMLVLKSLVQDNTS